MSSGIYAIIHTPTGARYIGQSSNIEQRWQSHVYLLRKHRHQSDLLQSAWDRDGVEAFSLEILEIVATLRDRRTREKYWQQQRYAETSSHGFNEKESPEHLKKIIQRKTQKVRETYQREAILQQHNFAVFRGRGGKIALPDLLAWREAKLLTREQLAEMSGVALSTITKLELNPQQRARFSTVEKLARALGIAKHTLTDAAPEPH